MAYKMINIMKRNKAKKREDKDSVCVRETERSHREDISKDLKEVGLSTTDTYRNSVPGGRRDKHSNVPGTGTVRRQGWLSIWRWGDSWRKG